MNDEPRPAPEETPEEIPEEASPVTPDPESLLEALALRQRLQRMGWGGT